MKLISFSRVINPHQHKLVKSKSSDVVFEFKIPKGHVGFINKVANSWYPNTYLEFIVDWEVVKVEREIAPINKPEEFDPPILVRNFVRWVAYNNDTSDHYFEVFCDGVLYKLD
jgi:hypothetical protein